MRISSWFGSGIRISIVLAAVQCSFAQPPAAPRESQGLPPRLAPSDYLAQAKVGSITIAADFTGHGIPNAEDPLNSEDFVAVEVGLFGAPDAHLTITASEFSLRINGKKSALPSQPWGLVAKNIKDPNWTPPEAEEGQKSKSSFGTGGQLAGSPPPLPPKPPIELLRNWQQRLKRAALAEGDRALPQAGLLFFQYRGKLESIKSVELLYEGPAGSATLTLQ